MLKYDHSTTAHRRDAADPLELRKFVGGRPPKSEDGGRHADMLRMPYTACKVTTGAVQESTVTPGPNSSTQRRMRSTLRWRALGLPAGAPRLAPGEGAIAVYVSYYADYCSLARG